MLINPVQFHNTYSESNQNRRTNIRPLWVNIDGSPNVEHINGFSYYQLVDVARSLDMYNPESMDAEDLRAQVIRKLEEKDWGSEEN